MTREMDYGAGDGPPGFRGAETKRRGLGYKKNALRTVLRKLKNCGEFGADRPMEELGVGSKEGKAWLPKQETISGFSIFKFFAYQCE